jgi:hypothetical protein
MGRTKPAQKKKWREFEKMIARIEGYFEGKGAVIRSPDKITDKITGEPREVDASIRYQVGSSAGLVTIECRDRKGIEDVTWVEQLVTKGRDIGAAQTIAVSSRRFSKGAIAKAKHHGIETRQVSHLSGEEIEQLFEKLRVEVGYFLQSIIHVQLGFPDVVEGLALADDIQSAYSRNAWDTPILFEKGTDKGMTLWEIVDEWHAHGRSLQDRNAPLGEKLRREFDCTFDGPVYARTNKGNLDLNFIRVTLDLERHRDRIAFKEGIQYANEGQAIAYVSQVNFAPCGVHQLTFTAHRKPDENAGLLIEVQATDPQLFAKGNFFRGAQPSEAGWRASS